jgi:hypothetical protein
MITVAKGVDRSSDLRVLLRAPGFRAATTASLFGIVASIAVAAQVSCGGGTGNEQHYASRTALLDPTQCRLCHADHYREWSGSMHAYASDDPVFLAMNARGQRETGGMLGDFCVKCHAPMAVREHATSDGLNLATVPAQLKGVTCFFCHTVDSVAGAHDDPLHIAADVAMRGPFANAIPNAAHPAAYSVLHDRSQVQSATLCGACHDIVNSHGAAIERTFREWQGTVFSETPGGATCGQCHMRQSDTLKPVAQVPGAPFRRYHGHDFPGVDLALTSLPEQATQKQSVQAFLDTTIQSALCIGAGTSGIHVILDNVAAGHGWPSGAAQDRRAWVEVIAYSAGTIVYQSGVVPDGMTPTAIGDPDLWLLRDCMLDGQNQPVPMFWQAANPSESHVLPGQITYNQLDPAYYATHVFRAFPRRSSLGSAPDRVTMRVRLQAVGLDVMDDLIASGDLDPSVRASIPTFDLGSNALVEWTPEKAQPGYVESGTLFTCVTGTNMNFRASRTPASASVHCDP